ncbi:MAG: hypothetical protein DWQ45_05480 [Planctomycetota bacterium]|nr:MAG: hypothetical protein DWQ29_14745 [Planctomycetota bacterium]REK20725.1 MAG: hypothetical protein DWQ41_24070 [Planctomycetota bacterium]REK38092.1 MAG: hypothetical protein DWQ45_05480 [Planctomycetota bacterium]
MPADRPKRTKTFVNARIQGRIIARIAGYWALYHVVLWHGLFIYRYAQHRADVANGGATMPFRDLYHQFTADYSPVIFCALLILPIFMIDFVRMTHRIAGPLVRFRSVLAELMDGKRVKRFELRKGDLLTEFEEDFNRFLGYYNARLDGLAPGCPHMSDEQADVVESIVERSEQASEDDVPLKEHAAAAADA